MDFFRLFVFKGVGFTNYALGWNMMGRLVLVHDHDVLPNPPSFLSSMVHACLIFS